MSKDQRMWVSFVFEDESKKRRRRKKTKIKKQSEDNENNIDYSEYYEYDKNYLKDHPLWEFQKEAVEKFMDIVENKRKKDVDVHILRLPTGTGKTRIANQIVNEFLDRHPRRGVLWLAHRWFLLLQASGGLARAYDKKDLQARIGGDNDPYIKFLDKFDKRNQDNKRVFYSTERTFSNFLDFDPQERRNLPEILKKNRNPLIVVDECHYGINGSSLGNILKYYRKYFRGNSKPYFLGLSATPKESTDYKFEQFYEKSYSDLSEYLAFPIIKDVETGFEWKPLLTRNKKQIKPSSLDKLRDKERNKKIVATLMNGRNNGLYKKTLIFACNIKHAKSINKLCGENQLRTVMIHSNMDKREREKMHNEFVTDKKDVLINVDMYTHGVDIPSIDSIFIARPTMSEALMMQMIGRGARLTENKKKFYIVEFRDTILNKVDLFHAKKLEESLGLEKYLNRSKIKNIKVERQDDYYEPEIPEFILLNGDEFGKISGIQYVKDETFGVEIEITSVNGIPDDKTWSEKAKLIIDNIKQYSQFGVNDEIKGYHETQEQNDYSRWSLEWDSSVGWEVISPILKNEDGFKELRNVCVGLDKLVEEDDILHINYRCGLHLHLGSNIKTDNQLKGFLRRIQRLEPGLFTLVSPSRLYNFSGGKYDTNEYNEYCQPVRNIDVDKISLDKFRNHHDNRYYTVNIINTLKSRNVLEIRMHNGTTDYEKIIPWISLWMHIFNHSRYEWTGEGDMKEIFKETNNNEEDIVKLIENEGKYPGQSGDHKLFIDDGGKLISLLKNRRDTLKDSWEKALPKKVKEWEKAGWYDKIDV